MCYTKEMVPRTLILPSSTVLSGGRSDGAAGAATKTTSSGAPMKTSTCHGEPDSFGANATEDAENASIAERNRAACSRFVDSRSAWR